MSVLKLDEVFKELMRHRNPSGTPVLQEVTHNGTRTLFIRFDNPNVRKNFTEKAGVYNYRRGSNGGVHYYLNIFTALGFESTIPWHESSGRPKLEFRLTDHPGYDVTINAYQNILLLSYSPEESNQINRFKERLDEKNKRYQHIRDALRNYQSPTASPARGPQAIQQSRIMAYQHGDIPGTSNFLQIAQSGGPVRRLAPSTSQRSAPYQQPQRSSSLRSSVYTSVPDVIPRPHAPRPPARPQTPYLSQPSTSSEGLINLSADDVDQFFSGISGRPPSRNR
ncbi:hypothetical protein [Xenorhabdus bharatensis]|uniref:hypothetical protein n=1 Tax=Xenorhabdus bharatensis TaxID=3136256 RepID=UPI0030F469DA